MHDAASILGTVSGFAILVSLLAFLRCRRCPAFTSMPISAFATVFEFVRGVPAVLWPIRDSCCDCCGANHVQPVKVAARALTISGLIQVCPLKKRLRHFFAEKPLKAH